MATFRPPLHRLDQLVEPLGRAAHDVVEALGALDDDWTVYIRPRLGLDVPDIVAVHERFGVCAIEVRGWSPGERRAGDGGRLLRADGDDGWVDAHEAPRAEAARIRANLYDQFFAMPTDGTDPTETVRAVVVLPNLSNAEAMNLLGHPMVPPAESRIAVWGREGLDERLDQLTRGHGCAHPLPASLLRLRQHLLASEIADPPAPPTPLGRAARTIESNPSHTHVRRFRGAAGSGKTWGLAARAAALAAEGKRPLLLSFNVTMANKLRLLAARRCRELGVNPTLVTAANFHSFCTRVVQEAAAAGIETAAPERTPWPEAIVMKARQALERGAGCRYDAVLVDEGQDFTLDWWTLLRQHVVAQDGEMVLVADPTQDLYERTGWADDDLSLATGFSAPWVDLTDSYRTPTDLVPLVNRFAADHLDHDDVMPATTPDDLAAVVGETRTTTRHWTNVERMADLGTAVGREVVRILRANPTLQPRDVAFVCEYHHDGVVAAAEIEAAGYPVHHIFSRNPDDPRRRRKYRFWPDADGVKGATAHSLKGWESPVLVMGIGVEARSRRHAYVAMTRVRSTSPDGVSILSVLNADRRLDELRSSFEAWAPPPSAARLA